MNAQITSWLRMKRGSAGDRRWNGWVVAEGRWWYLRIFYSFEDRIAFIWNVYNRPPLPHSRVGWSKPITSGSFQETNLRGYVAQKIDYSIYFLYLWTSLMRLIEDWVASETQNLSFTLIRSFSAFQSLIVRSIVKSFWSDNKDWFTEFWGFVTNLGTNDFKYEFQHCLTVTPKRSAQSSNIVYTSDYIWIWGHIILQVVHQLWKITWFRSVIRFNTEHLA